MSVVKGWVQSQGSPGTGGGSGSKRDLPFCVLTHDAHSDLMGAGFNSTSSALVPREGRSGPKTVKPPHTVGLTGGEEPHSTEQSAFLGDTAP